MNSSKSMDAILEALNPEQRQAVETIQGPLMTLAGPGSGKTRVVTHRIAYMIEQGIPSSSILAMTFTNKAAQAIRERVKSLVGDQPITMGTFHGFGARFLRRYGRSVGLGENFSIYDTDDSKKALERAVIKAKVKLTHVTIGQLAKEISRLKTNLITPEILDQHRLGSLQHIVSQVYPAYQQQLLECGAVDFDDLLLHPAIILRTEPELRADLDRRYEFIMVDEYQDTNFAQYVIVRALSIDHPNLNVTGDPDQSIYGWRGANIENILTFEKDFPTAKIVRLEQNYRSTPEILSIADSLIHYNVRRKAKTLIATRPEGARVRLAHYPSDQDEAENIADQIRACVTDNGERASDFAVLYRTNAQSRLLEKALISRRLNYQLIGGFRFYQRQEIKDLIAYLRMVHNPRDDIAFGRVINTPPRGLGDKTIEKVSEIAIRDRTSMIDALITAADSGALSKKATLGARQFLKLWRQLVELSSGKLVDLILHLLESTAYVEYLSKKKSAEPDDSVDENVNELLADARQIDEEAGDSNSLEMFLEQVSLLADADQMENAADRVTLMTLHAAKGLEFPTVFLIAVEENILPHIRSKDDPQQVEEERRLLFVGITRAMDRLQLSTANRRGFQNRTSVPSPFLMEIPRLELEIIDMTENRYDYDSEDEYGYSDSGDDDFISEPSFEFGSSSKTEKAYEIAFTPEELESNSKLKPSVVPRNKLAPALQQSILKNQKPDLAKSLKSGASVSPLTTASGVEVKQFQAGSRVIHPAYGIGKIVSVDGHGTKRRAVVQFEAKETKTFVLAQSPLTLK
ncbi:MAG: 3'-5' exonuclease [Pirellulaceae bacterium]|nr:3'-5' exonuclease [Pirellulaceae bacterium]